ARGCDWAAEAAPCMQWRPDLVKSTLAALAALEQGLREDRSLLQQKGVDVASLVDSAHNVAASLADQFEANPAKRGRPPGRGARTSAQISRSLKKQKEKVGQIRKRLGAEGARGHRGRIELIWFVRAGLADPSIPRRVLANMFYDHPLEHSQPISQSLVSVVRDAFVEVLKKINRSRASYLVSSPGSDPLFVHHVHDEAAMRMKSFAAVESGDLRLPPKHGGGGLLLPRSHTSKVQNHVVTLKRGDVSVEWWSELQALLKKDASTVATSIIGVVEAILEEVDREKLGDTVLRLVHLVTGDAIPTNHAAMKLVASHFMRPDAPSWFLYRACLWICATHQANLATAVAVCRSAAKKDVDRNPLQANCSRFFKHLMPEYIEEFGRNLRQYVVREMARRQGAGAAAGGVASQMQRLYGKDVLPDALLDVYAPDLSKLEAPYAEGDRPKACGEVYVALHKLVLRCESKPIRSRFWLFAECVATLLRMKLIGLPSSVFTLQTIKPRAENQTRLRKFREWYDAPATVGDLKRASLCLQLTGIATSISAQKQSGDREPTLVRLGRGEVQERVSARLGELIPLLAQDACLDCAGALADLLRTASHVVGRFDEYQTYPTELWRLTKRYNPDGYPTAAKSFLKEPERLLDAGYSLPLRREALACGGDGMAELFLASPSVQRELEGILEGAPSSMDAERKHAHDKMHDSVRKVSGLPRSSRDSMIKRYRIMRHERLRAADAVRRRVVKQKHIQAWSLAVQRRPDLLPRPVGKRFGAEGAEDRSATAHAGNMDELRSYYREHEAELRAEAKQIRDQAKAPRPRKKGLMPDFPISNLEWLDWFHEGSNEATFRALLKTATTQRRALAGRLVPQERLPAPVRLQPDGARASAPAPWTPALARLGSGFFAFKVGPAVAQKVAVWYARFKRQDFCVVLREVGRAAYAMDFGESFHKHLVPLDVGQALDDAGLSPADVRVYQLTMAVSFGEGDKVTLKACAAELLDLSAASAPPEDDGEVSEDFEAGSSDAETVASALESAAEDEAEEGADAAEAEGEGDGEEEAREEEEPEVSEAEMRRAASGALTVETDGYFSLSRDPDWPDAKMRIAGKRWTDHSEMRRDPQMSRTLTLAHYGDSAHNPIRTYAALRAWKLWRARQHGWHARKAVRLAWHARELVRLRAEIAEAGAGAEGTTGNAA
ncbi:unnamed protein product, partial [Prorocentrum cordatum]